LNSPLPTLLSAQLTVSYTDQRPVLCAASIEVGEGEILGLVGQSGSGKSTLALAILGLLDRKKAQVSGSVVFQQRDLLKLSDREWRTVRGRAISLVLQSPLTSLNPALRIQTQLREAWNAHASGTSADRDAEIRRALTSASLPSDSDFLRRYSAQLSVGQAQRVLIALALLHRPALLIADEATSALDVITQSEILRLFSTLNRETKISILYISHDLPSVASICHRIAILHQGEIVECRQTAELFSAPVHPYTRQLLSAQPRPQGADAAPARMRAATAGATGEAITGPSASSER
jgi:peptide/nickel transport system ATP-binding protein